MAPKDLLWVAANPAGQTPKETRTQIRKQVMKSAVEAKRRKAKEASVAVAPDAIMDAAEDEKRDKPPILVPKPVKGKLVLTLANGKSARQWRCRDVGVPAHLPLTGVEKLVSTHGLDRHTATQVFGIISLETLCSHFLNAHPELLSQIVIQPADNVDEYFGHVARYYGHSRCLDDAIQVVVAQAQANLSPQAASSEREILIKYGKALRSLQEAISSASWEGPEVICATQLLALFEVLHSNGLDRWRGHIQGAVKLMRLRGPGKHRTNFDVNLFLNLYPAITCEAFMKCQACLFLEPEWQDFIDDITDHDDPFSERGRLNMKSACMLFRAVNSVQAMLPLLVEAAEPDDPRVLEVADGLYQATSECAAWFDDFSASLQKLHPKKNCWATNAQLRITYTMGNMVHMVLCRLLATMSPSTRPQSERMAQMRAGEILQLVASVPADDHKQRLILRQEKNIAVGIAMTAEDWEVCADSGKLVDSSTFLKFCQIISDSGHREFGDLRNDAGFVRFGGFMSGQPGFEKKAEPVAPPFQAETLHRWTWAGNDVQETSGTSDKG